MTHSAIGITLRATDVTPRLLRPGDGARIAAMTDTRPAPRRRRPGGRCPLVAQRRRLPGLPPLLRGQRRRRRRRPARHRAAGWTTCRRWAWTCCGCRRCTRRRRTTTATTSATTTTWTRCSAASPTSTSWSTGCTARHAAGHGPGRQPHLRRAPVVRREPLRPTARAGTGTGGARRARATSAASPGPSRPTGSPSSRGPRGSGTRRRGEYYLHLFSRKQPDLDWENPEVRARSTR